MSSRNDANHTGNEEFSPLELSGKSTFIFNESGCCTNPEHMTIWGDKYFFFALEFAEKNNQWAYGYHIQYKGINTGCGTNASGVCFGKWRKKFSSYNKAKKEALYFLLSHAKKQPTHPNVKRTDAICKKIESLISGNNVTDLVINRITNNVEKKCCRVCGCTDHDCRQCIAKTGSPCHWVEEDLCSACIPESQNDNSLSNNTNMAKLTAGSKKLNKTIKTTDAKASLVVFLSMGAIHPSKTNPRKSFEKENIKDLADSMTTVGLLSPITVRPAGDKYEIVAGERRFMAAKLLKWENISCISRNITDDEMLEIQIIENLQREDVSPMDEAAAFKTLLKKESIEWLASKIHKTKKYIIDRLKLNELIKEAEEYVQKGILPLGHAVVISKLSFADQKQCLQKCINNGFGENTDDDYCKMPLEELKDFIADDIMLEFEKVNFDTDDATLYPIAGSCTTCPKRTCNSNLLFDDITKDDKCTDTACFHEKINLHVTREKSKAKETYGKVLAGERDGYSGSGVIKVQGVTMKYTETPGKNGVPVVLTKTDRFNKNTLGATVFVDSKLLEHSKKAVEEKKTERKNNGGNDYEAQKKKEFISVTWPKLQMIIGNLPINNTVVREYFREKFDKWNNLRNVMTIAGILGFNGFAKTPEQCWEQKEDEWGLGFKKEMYDKVIDHVGSADQLILLDMLLDHIRDDEDDEIDHEEEFGFSWKELMEKIHPKPAIDKKTSKKSK